MGATVQHFVNISGGKDSTACYLLALQSGRQFRAIMADTGNENPLTIEYARTLHEKTGGPRVEFFKADFSEKIRKKREFVQSKWPGMGVPDDLVSRAIETLQPTGNPFLDLCIWKGRFPSRRAQFCTEFLKSEPITTQVIDPARKAGPIVQWLGVRRDESLNRRFSPMLQAVRTPGVPPMRFYRPLIHWTAQNCFSFAASFGLDPNPLYLEGMSRVGCFPCINANKGEIRAIAKRFPEAFDRIEEWENVVKMASKRNAATFFAPGTTPESAALSRSLALIDDPDERAAASAAAPWPRAWQVAEWSRTDRGGRQQNLFTESEDDGVSCSSQYGLCE
jgi:3'-phosphoadenosine 5'-phosphosulfate sulfotransferase (PAPS reductase)/FAD synthetase